MEKRVSEKVEFPLARGLPAIRLPGGSKKEESVETNFDYRYCVRDTRKVLNGLPVIVDAVIIHRDLAARNILITEEHTCKVADFGFARDVIASHVYERKSEGRLPIRWMAPESLYDNIFTVKSDVWSFGVLIWEVVRDGYRLDKPEHCRRELYNIMYYCWDKDPKERPSFCECVELLEKLLLSETDYIELERFPDHSYYNMMGMSGEKL
ncbi:unnamed protein product [Phaedon cochleariae]|uniref:Protein kinase domain-containing protein n=1 Tax=Phaedon cochleariae TaxID=80249 RepID=A0A9N9X2N6_PHACE|nr:unnamed protein product [Phaedon cochleariae]